MTERELTPAEEDRVRRLLADARHDAPIPDDVAERLDAVLRDLARERPTAPVADLAARRRRRRASGLLVAAAAVTVLGVGTPQLLGGVTGNDSSSGGDAGSAADMPEVQSQGKGEAQRDGTAAPGDRVEVTKTPSGRLRAGTFRRDVAGLRYRLSVEPTPAAPEVAPTEDPELATCRGTADWGVGQAFLVTYDGAPAGLVFRAPEGDRQRADLFACGESEPLRSVVVPVP